MKNYLFIFLALLLSACSKNELDSLKFNPPSRSYDLVIEGGINTFQRVQYIRLSLPIFNTYAVAEPAKGAKVFVNDGKQDIEFRETTTAGLYSGLVINNVNYNKGYKLTVKYKDKEYTASDTLRQVISVIDDFLPFGASEQTNGNVRLTIPKHTFGYLNSSKWLIAYQGIPLWSPSKLDGTFTYNYTHTQGSPNSIYPLVKEIKNVDIPPDDLVTIYKFSLSDEYAKYLYSIFQETDWKGIFSSTPSTIQGNISEGAIGFFYVMDVDVRRYQAKDLIN